MKEKEKNTKICTFFNFTRPKLRLCFLHKWKGCIYSLVSKWVWSFFVSKALYLVFLGFFFFNIFSKKYWNIPVLAWCFWLTFVQTGYMSYLHGYFGLYRMPERVISNKVEFGSCLRMEWRPFEVFPIGKKIQENQQWIKSPHQISPSYCLSINPTFLRFLIPQLNLLKLKL